MLQILKEILKGKQPNKKTKTTKNSHDDVAEIKQSSLERPEGNSKRKTTQQKTKTTKNSHDDVAEIKQSSLERPL